jgi:hypothetical protein
MINWIKAFFGGIKTGEKKTSSPPKEFSVEEFNEWFKNDYSGYSGYPGGARGIFLRTSKLSPNMVSAYLKEIGHESPDYGLVYECHEKVDKDWREKLKNS